MSATDVSPDSVVEPTAAEAAAAAANPALVGVPTFVISSIVLGLWLVGYQGAATPGLLVTTLVVTGIGQIVACVWAAALGQGPVAAIFGIFGGFWVSFPLLVLGNTHGWFVPKGTPAAAAATSAAGGTVAYLLAWTLLIAILTLATLRLPLAFTLLFAVITITFLLVFLANATGMAALGVIGGITTFVFTIIGIYIFFGVMGNALGGRAPSLGSPVRK